MHEKIQGWMTDDLSNAIDRIAARLADARAADGHVHVPGTASTAPVAADSALLNMVDGLPSQVRDEVLRRYEARRRG